jgi:hypothetical protein
VKWRRPEARLLAALACIPQTPVLYEVVPLFLLVRTFREAAVLVVLTGVAGRIVNAIAVGVDYHTWMTINWPVDGVARVSAVHGDDPLEAERRSHIRLACTPLRTQGPASAV